MSTVQKIGLTIDQLFLTPGLVWKRVSPIDVITMGQSTTIWPFPTKQPGDPNANLLLSSEKAVSYDTKINDFNQIFLALFISMLI